MPFVAPKIVGMLTVYSKRIRVANQLPNTKVQLLRNGAIAQLLTNNAGGAAKSTTVTLAFGDAITVQSYSSSEQSPISDPLYVATASPLRAAQISSAVTCSQFFVVDQITAGATVIVEGRTGLTSAWIQQGTLISPTQSTMAVPVTSGVINGVEFRCRQSVPAGFTGTSSLGDSMFGTSAATPNSVPSFDGPLVPCARSIAVSNLTVGTSIEVLRNGSVIGGGYALIPRGTVSLGAGQTLAVGDSITVRTSFKGCEGVTAAQPQSVTATVPNSLPTPWLAGPICGGATAITAGGLVVGEQVDIFQGGVLFASAIASETVETFRIAALGLGQTVVVGQTFCGKQMVSNTVTTGTTSTALPVPVVLPTLVACGTLVQVDNVEVGSRVEVLSKDRQGTLGIVQSASAKKVDVQLGNSLRANEQIFARVRGCSQLPQESAVVTVGAVTLTTPILEVPEEGVQRLKIRNLTVGATVIVERNSARVMTFLATATTAEVDLPEWVPALYLEDFWRVGQFLCNQSTAVSSAVQRPVPFAPWKIVNTLDMLAVHTAMLPSGKVLLFGGTEHNWSPKNVRNSNHCCVYDPSSNTYQAVQSPAFDLFCCGHAQMANGDIFAAGGTTDYPNEGPADSWYSGARGAARFNWQTESWELVPSMQQYRWYPTVLALADGRVLVAGGATRLPLNTVVPPANQNDAAKSWEVYDNATNTWGTVPRPSPTTAQGGAYYTRMFVVPGGVFNTVGRLTPEATPTPDTVPRPTYPHVVNLVSGAQTEVPYSYDFKDYGNWNHQAALLPFRQGIPWEVAVLGDFDRAVGTVMRPTKVPFGLSAASLRALPALGDKRRADACVTLLANGQLGMFGGAANGSSKLPPENTYARQAELYDPVANTWSVRANALVD
jgi:hypothetical protein